MKTYEELQEELVKRDNRLAEIRRFDLINSWTKIIGYTILLVILTWGIVRRLIG